ncbi:hypothetical protein HK104_010783 [Borealophlyctis nickersoniae]|nr:hypothetical protein HK104_010783 [Borealophlyctis nickersoniae]
MVSLSRNGEYIQSVFSRVGDNIEWSAPEVMAQNNNYDEKADIYSFGITALELCFNRTPFDGWPALKVLLSKLEYDCPAIETSKTVSTTFYRMVRSCIYKDANERPSAQDLMDHPFFKNARNSHYLETHVIRKSGLLAKHESARPASANTGSAGDNLNDGSHGSIGSSGKKQQAANSQNALDETVENEAVEEAGYHESLAR